MPKIYKYLLIAAIWPLLSGCTKWHEEAPQTAFYFAISGAPSNYDELEASAPGSLRVSGPEYSVPLEIRADGGFIENTPHGGIIAPFPKGTKVIDIAKDSGVEMFYAVQRIEHPNTERQRELILAKGTIDPDLEEYSIDLSQINLELEE